MTAASGLSLSLSSSSALGVVVVVVVDVPLLLVEAVSLARPRLLTTTVTWQYRLLLEPLPRHENRFDSAMLAVGMQLP